MMETNPHHESSVESFEDLATDLIESGVVTIMAAEDLIGSKQLLLSLHLGVDADLDAIRNIVDDTEEVRVDDHVFDLYCDIDPWAPSDLGKVTVYFKAPEDETGCQIVSPTSLDDGIDEVLARAE